MKIYVWNRNVISTDNITQYRVEVLAETQEDSLNIMKQRDSVFTEKMSYDFVEEKDVIPPLILRDYHIGWTPIDPQ